MTQTSFAEIEKQTFVETFRYKLIYVYAIDDKPHEGFLKVGDTTVVSQLPPDMLTPNCRALDEAARARIDGQTQTPGVEYRLLYTELAVRYRTLSNGAKIFEHFTDKKVHAVLKNSGIPHKFIGRTKGREWFGADLKTIKAAIEAVKEYRSVIAGGELELEDPIVFREEQQEAIDRTLTRFKKGSDMLWDAKMRFGKTLTALQVVREAKDKFRRVIIVTHRPVVGSGWQEDFNKLFSTSDGYNFYSKDSLVSNYEFSGKVEAQNDKKLARLDESGARFIYFASIQDLRGSQMAGGKFDKNRGVFKMDWDLVIVDEAHEGTQTDLGKEVRQLLVKKHTKVLSLSGTPFNILSQYDADAVYVWDYVMEQQRKEEWEGKHPDEPNPYAQLPRLNLYTYDLGSELEGFSEEDLEGKAFNFREFFRTWTGDRDIDFRPVPRDANVGDFVHEDDVRRFLDLISGDSAKSRYPFSTQDRRDLFRHTLWMVPGVASAKALSAMLREHRYFRHYGIANVAGEGDDYEERHFDSALELVRKTIRENEHSITLSCGKLTTGVTVPEWTAVLMIAGSAVTSASQYMQTIFRVQSPGDLGGMMKTNCYAFDFAPDRALKVLAETAQVSRRFSKSTDDASGRKALGEFLNYCPVISISGTRMEPYDVKKMMASIKHIFVMKTIRNGFDDSSLYSNKLLELKDVDLRKFEDLRAIVGTSKQTKAADTVFVNEQDFDDEEREKTGRAVAPRPPLSEEEKAAREELKRRREEKKRAILILRAISIRMPLLIYGADVPIDKVISISEFPDLVDDESWEEFMPRGVTKAIFRKFVEYYDADVFAEAGTQIRKLAKSADKLPPTRRVQQIARIFSYFKNPDKETVLTPWRVVNMHLADTIGGWCFYDENFEKPLEDAPRQVIQKGVTQEVFGKPDAKVLEINSKSGLYPLYVAYSLYRRKLGDVAEDAIMPRERDKLWREVVARSLFVVCKTPMAKTITQRTLVGYTDAHVNAQYIKNLVEMLKTSPNKFYNKVCGGNAWNNKEFAMKMLKFDAVVGNPPYQLMGGSGGTNDAPIFQYFCQGAKVLQSRYVSMIIPAKWFAAGRESQLKDFREQMLNGGHIRKLFAFSDSHSLFPSAEIKGGVCYYLEDSTYNGNCDYTLEENGERATSNIALNEFPVFIRNPKTAAIVKKVRDRANEDGVGFVETVISADTPFGIPTNPGESKKTPIDVSDKKTSEFDTILYYLVKSKRVVGYVRCKDIAKNAADVKFDKVFIPGAYGAGEGFPHQILGVPEIAPKKSVCSQTYLYAKFDSHVEAVDFAAYLKTRFFRILVCAAKVTQHAQDRVYRFVPLQDFTSKSDIDWSRPVPEIDAQLYAKYGITRPEQKFIESMIKPME
jgi:hypothetical protein